MPPLFNYRLNHVVVPMVFINREKVNGNSLANGILPFGSMALDASSSMTKPAYGHERPRPMCWKSEMKLSGSSSIQRCARGIKTRAGSELHPINSFRG
jgi:hypothetical protein